MIDKKETGLQIYKMAEKAGFNQSSLARKMDLSPQAVNKWMNGKILPSPDNLLQLSRIVGCRIEDLLIEKEGAIDGKEKE